MNSDDSHCLATMLLAQVNRSLQPVTLADGSTVYIQCTPADNKFMDGQLIQLEDRSAAHYVSKTDETSKWTSSPLCDVIGSDGLRLENGQAVQLEDGTIAYIQTPRETYGQNTLQAVQLEDGTTAYIQHTVHMPQSNTILATQADGTVSDFNDGTIDPETISVLEQYASKVEADKPATNSGIMETDQDETVPMQVHERVHTSGQPYLCHFKGCGKKYGTGYDLKSHLKTHTGETPYRCQELTCRRSFRTSGQLLAHVRTHTGERPFSCPFEGCGRTFIASNARKVHIRKHTGERPYTCAEPGCGRSFTSTGSYRSHIRIHTGEKPYLCTVPGCDKRFTEYSTLYKHHEVHIPFNPYSCNHCGKSYKTISSLARHKLTAHQNAEVIEEEQEAYFESPAENLRSH
ncbi:zinc finger protein 143a isoform X3 [Osmerus eperlanus]|uniref:zinc finger protein 143a isoform X3 n=2 Tax=Osmerus eperlanus TaxID=29151 RepID=UPI002E14641D